MFIPYNLITMYLHCANVVWYRNVLYAIKMIFYSLISGYRTIVCQSARTRSHERSERISDEQSTRGGFHHQVRPQVIVIS